MFCLKGFNLYLNFCFVFANGSNGPGALGGGIGTFITLFFHSKSTVTCDRDRSPASFEWQL